MISLFKGRKANNYWSELLLNALLQIKITTKK